MSKSQNNFMAWYFADSFAWSEYASKFHNGSRGRSRVQRRPANGQSCHGVLSSLVISIRVGLLDSADVDHDRMAGGGRTNLPHVVFANQCLPFLSLWWLPDE